MPVYSQPCFSPLSVHKPALLFINPAHIWAVFPHLYNNDDLALFEANSNCRSSSVLRCFVCGDDFQQLHSVNRGEVVHPNHLGRRKSSGLSRVRQTLAPRVTCWASQVPDCRGKQASTGCRTHHHSALCIQPHCIPL